MKKENEKMIVITGGFGFIGSCLVTYLNQIGKENLIIVDQLGMKDKWKNLVGKRFIDVLEKSELFDWLNGRHSEIEAIIHLGACSSTVETNASYLLENNYRFTKKLAEYALKHDLRMIYASSAATYGDGSLGFSDDESMLEELKPLNMYGFSKHLFDLWAKREGVLNKLVGLKYFNVFGPNEAHKERMASAVFHFMNKVKLDGKVQLFKSQNPKLFFDGEQKRDFIYVKDAVKMTAAFLENEASGIYNIGTGVANSWNLLAKALFKALEKPLNIDYVEMPKDLIGKYQDYTIADMNKTKKVLGSIANTMPLEDSVIDYVRNYLLPEKTY